MKLRNESIRAAQDAVAVAEAALRRAVVSAQLQCSHRDVGECSHGGGLSPFRVCLDCGLTEEGWGANYQVLNNQLVYKLDNRNTAYGLRAGSIIRDEDKAQLLRKEKSVQQMIERHVDV